MDTDYLRQVDWWSRVNRGDHEECWLWTQSCGSHGYGQTWDGSTVLLAHRVAWTLVNGEIPDGLTIDHVCRNRKCCNPSHLRLLSNIDNATDNGQISKTHCPARHDTEERICISIERDTVGVENVLVFVVRGGHEMYDDQYRDHTYISFNELRDLLGMTGIPIKVWVEPDQDFLHMVTLCEHSDPNGKMVCEGGFVEARDRHRTVLRPVP